jgi:hypothetical protein
VIHVRIDNNELNAAAQFACGIGWPLPEGDKYWFQSESGADRSDCPGCNPGGPRQLGTPISQIATQLGQRGCAEWLRISKSWGYE